MSLHAAPIDTAISASWTGVPLRQWTDAATTLAGRPVILDRRIDPTTPVTLDVREEPCLAMIERVAAGADATIDRLAATLRIVPRSQAGRAAAGEAARQRDLATLPASLRRAAATRKPLTWHDAATPRDILASLAADGGVQLSEIASVPHDHLPAASFPALTLGERFDLVLASYDLRARWTTEGATIEPLPEAAKPTARPTPPKPPRARPVKPGAVQRYTLTLDAPFDQALEAVATRLALALMLDRPSLQAAGIAPGEIVRVRVRDASREELLNALVAPIGLTWRIDGSALHVAAPASVDPAPGSNAPR